MPELVPVLILLLGLGFLMTARRFSRTRTSTSILTALLALAAQAQHSSEVPDFAAVEGDARKFQLAPGLHLETWAAEPQLLNPVAFSLVPARTAGFVPRAGTNALPVAAYVAETHRLGVSVPDITQNTAWLLDDLSLRTVPEREAFLLGTAFATNTVLLTRDSEILRLVADTTGDARADRSAVFADGFNSPVDGVAAGVLAQGTNLWFGNIPNLWRFSPQSEALSRQPSAVSHQPETSEPRIPTANSQWLLATGFGVHLGVIGHDLHGLIRGPDGRLYLSFGDRGVCITNREGVVINLPDTGGVLRCEPDGRGLEVFCIGLRNPHELAFDDFGNLFTVDNDTAGADRCRVLHLVEGGDYGWRASYQHMRGFGPWVQEGLWAGGLDGVLPPAGYVSQGPAGLAYHPGTGFARYRGKFLHADFPGGIWTFSVQPHGASFAVADKEKVLWNAWPTDVEFGPDGALYVLDWVAGWGLPGKGRIHRVTDTTAGEDPATAAPAREVYRLLAEGMTHRPEPELLALLGHPDRRVRLEAQWELGGRGTNSLPGLVQAAKTGNSLQARIQALWGFEQIIRRLPVTEAAAEAAELIVLLADKEPEVRGQAAVALGAARLMNAERLMTELLGDPEARVRLLAAHGAIRRWSPEVMGSGRQPRYRVHVPPLQKLVGQTINVIGGTLGLGPDRIFDLAHKAGATIVGSLPARELAAMLAARAPDAFEDHAVVSFLEHSSIYTGAYRSWFSSNQVERVRQTAIWKLRRLGDPEVADYLVDASPRLAVEAARAINDLPVPEAYPALAAQLGVSEGTHKIPEPPWLRIPDLTLAAYLEQSGTPWTGPVPLPTNVATLRWQFLKRALNAHFRLGHATNAAALAGFAAQSEISNLKSEIPAAARVEALFLLGAWEVLPAAPGRVPAEIQSDPNHGSTPTVNPENWPGWFDRVVGLWRPLPPRPPDDARVALAGVFAGLIAPEQPEPVQLAAVEAAGKLRVEAAAGTLADLVTAARPVAVRAAALRALAEVGAAPLFTRALNAALAAPEAELRRAAIALLGDHAAPGTAAALGRFLETETDVSLKQTALAALGRLPGDEATALLGRQVEALIAGKLPAALHLDVRLAAEARQSPALDALLARRRAALAEDPLGEFADVLVGGDAAHGRAVFFEKAETQCLRCHQVKGEGGIVGPALDGIARRLDRRALLETILHPNAQIASGYENVVLTLADGRTLAGTVKEEDAEKLLLAAGEDGDLTLPMAAIIRRERTLSAMPEGLHELMSRRELRDLVEYLAGLK